MAQDTELAGYMLGGGYRLVRRIGEDVPALYEVRHPRLAGRFAARLWPPTIPWDAFRRGAELVATLRHPGVVQVIDFNCEPGASPFLIMEWLDGTTLADVLAASGLLPMPRVAALVESAAWALASAHQQGVVHQELSPADIFVVQAAGTTREWTKVDGFGVAAALSRAGAAVPSPYRAPEQLTPDEEGADPQSDQYALAAIAYEMLSGVRPIDDERSPGRPPPLTELAHDVTSPVDAVVRQALAPDPEERFAGVLEFARALRDAAHGGSTQVIRRRKAEGRAAGRSKSAEGETPVSPFFNPIQAVWGSDRVPFAGMNWRALVSRVLPGGVSARVALALGVLLLAFGGVAVALRKPVRRPQPQITASVPRPAAAPRPLAAPALAPTPPPPSSSLASALAPMRTTPAKPVTMAESPAVLPTLAVKLAPEVEPLARAAESPDPPARPVPARRARPARPAAQAAAAGRAAAASSTVALPAAAPPAAAPAKATPPTAAPAKAAPANAVPAKAVTSTAAAPPPATAPSPAGAAVGDASCAIFVASRPPAELWLDGRSTGRRTPVNGYRVTCGDHKLVLKRDDLELYQMEMITVRAGTPFKKTYPLR